MWDLIQRSRDSAPENRKGALEALFNQYYKPVYRFFQKVLRIDERHLEDVTQDFFTRFVEKDFLRNVQRKVSFRGFLKVACRRHFINWMEAQKAAKRGGGRSVALEDHEVFLAATSIPETQFDGMIDDELRTWYLEAAVEHVRQELTAHGKEQYFRIFEARSGLGGGKPATYKSLSQTFGIPVYDVSNHFLVARRIFRRSLLQLAEERSPDPKEELRDLGLLQYLA